MMAVMMTSVVLVARMVNGRYHHIVVFIGTLLWWIWVLNACSVWFVFCLCSNENH
jgi:hypothetical protein